MSVYPPGTTEEDIERVYLDAHRETRIEYSKNGGFFGPRLRNINYLEVGRSKIINSWFTRIAEYLLIYFQAFKTLIKQFLKWLYPRRNKIYGTGKDGYISGKITFSKKDDHATPIHNMQVEFWARTWFGGWRLFAKGFTNREGEFKLFYDFIESRKFRYHTFHFEAHQTTHVFFHKEHGSPMPKYEVFERVKVKKGDLSGMGYSMGNMQLFYWEYRTDVPLPRVVIKDHDVDAPEYYSDGRNFAAQQQFVPIEITKEKHLVQIALDPDSISIPEIQADYPLNLTVAMENKLPYSTRCDYWFGRRMLNGMNCASFIPDNKIKDHYWVKYFGACNYQVNDEYAFPSAEVLFRLAKNKLPLPIKIILTGPISSFEKDPFHKHEFTPEDGDKWEYAKRVVRVTGALSTELDDHFSGTHLNTEQFAVAARRNIRKSPIATLLFPHLKEVVLVNHSADAILIGPGYIPRASAITADGIINRAKDMLGAHDWKNWTPMKVISDAHSYAKAEQLFWNITSEFVEKFFKENLDQIKKEWYEIYCFSNDLVKNSAPLFGSDIDFSKLSKEESQFTKDRINYCFARYRLDPTLKRVQIGGITKSISPITSKMDNPTKVDIDNLKSACKYAIMMATYMHTWINEHQYEDIGEILYSSLGLRFGDSKDGILRPENDYAIAPDLTRSTQMMWFSNLLSRTEYGFIVRNEENDVDPIFSKMLEAKRKEFKDLYVDIDSIESRTNI